MNEGNPIPEFWLSLEKILSDMIAERKAKLNPYQPTPKEEADEQDFLDDKQTRKTNYPM